MKLFLSGIIKSFLCIVLCTSISVASATEIKSLRSYVNTDKTRIVIDVRSEIEFLICIYYCRERSAVRPLPAICVIE